MNRLFAFIADRMRQDDNRPAMPTEPTIIAWERWRQDDALAARKARRPANSARAIKGHQTRRAKA